MTNEIIQFNDLQRLSGYERRADVIRWAEREGVRFRYARNGIWTTSEALNAALGLQSTQSEAYGVDILP